METRTVKTKSILSASHGVGLARIAFAGAPGAWYEVVKSATLANGTRTLCTNVERRVRGEK